MTLRFLLLGMYMTMSCVHPLEGLSQVHTYVAEASPSPTPSSAPDYRYTEAHNILQCMHRMIRSLEAHQYRLHIEERRMGGVWHKGEIQVEVQRNPLKVSIEVFHPEKGAQVAYNAAEDPNSAVITPKKWIPAIKYRKSLNSKVLRRGHYAVHESTLHFFDQLIQQYAQQFRQRNMAESAIRYMGLISQQGKRLHRIELVDTHYRIQSRQVAAGESLSHLAQQLALPLYKLRELNPQVAPFDALRSTKTLRIPSSYAKRSVILVDAVTYLPYSLEVHDDKGRFEQYRFENIQ